MAQSLRIGAESGTPQQVLYKSTATDPKLLRYVPRTPDLSALDFTAETMRDGGERFVTTRRNVTESARISIEGTDAAAVRTIVQNIETIFRRAEEWQRVRVGAPVYVFHTPDGYSAPHSEWRSEILSGRIDLADRAFDYGYWTGHVEALVTWTRRYYWEAGTVTALTLTNGSGTAAAITITNDPAGNNYADVAGSAIFGTIPTPAILDIRNATAGTNIYSIYTGLNTWSTPSGFAHVLQGEDATLGGTPAVDANASAGDRSDFTLTTTETELGRWTLTASTMVKPMAGRYVRLLARFAIESAALPVPFGIRPKILLGTGDVIWTGPEMLITASYALRDLGLIPLPPYSVPFGDPATLGNLQLQLTGRSLTGASTTLRLDYIQLTPVDSYRVLEPCVYGLANGRSLVDDPAAGNLYQETTSDNSGRSNVYLASGTPIMLWPGRDARLYFLFSTADNKAPITRTATVLVWVRHRRLTI